MKRAALWGLVGAGAVALASVLDYLALLVVSSYWDDFQADLEWV